MFQRVLIANRGEIAARVSRTCRWLGIESHAVYSVADADALHVREADGATHIGAAPVAESYINVDAVLDAPRSRPAATRCIPATACSPRTATSPRPARNGASHSSDPTRRTWS